METLSELLVEQLQDLYDAENQVLLALPDIITKSTNQELKRALEEHLAETQKQIERIEQAGMLLDCNIEGRTCRGMQGILRECMDNLRELAKTDTLRDVMVVADVQRMEHYEIAGYGNAIALAEFLDRTDVSDILADSLNEEKNADDLLTRICELQLFDACEDDSHLVIPVEHVSVS